MIAAVRTAIKAIRILLFPDEGVGNCKIASTLLVNENRKTSATVLIKMLE